MTERLSHPRVTREPDVLRTVASDASGMSHVPDGLARPRSETEVEELVRLAAAYGEPITPQGLRSSTTGSSVPARGLALSLESMDRVLEIDPDRRIARAEPGVNLGALKRTLAEQGLFYPPDPTSEDECTLGGTVATNASGSRSLRYGATRPWIRALRVVTADGRAFRIPRIRANKNATGYFGIQDPIDLFIGSEGTLGVVTEVEIALLPAPPEPIAGFAFFRDWREALRFVVGVVQPEDRAPGGGPPGRSGRPVSPAGGPPASGVSPRCLELFDRVALDLVRGETFGPPIPEDAGAALFFEEEAGERAPEVIERWIEALEEATPLSGHAFLAQTRGEQRQLRDLRHAIPARMNEAGARVVRNGGRKVSTDFAVPLEHLETLVEETLRCAEERFGGRVIAYGHVGNGHPHFNLLAEGPADLARAEEVVRIMSRRALELGGTLSAEHGIGKIKAPLFRELYPAWMVEAMVAVKERLDPKGILAPGNLFGPS